MNNLENFKTIELSNSELEQTNGGNPAIAVAVALFVFKVCWDMGAAYRE
jgi:hypothetical protein